MVKKKAKANTSMINPISNDVTTTLLIKELVPVGTSRFGILTFPNSSEWLASIEVFDLAVVDSLLLNEVKSMTFFARRARLKFSRNKSSARPR